MYKITESDYSKIFELIKRNNLQGKVSDLEKKLLYASLIDSQTPPENLVTMESEVETEDLYTAETMKVRLVYQISQPFTGNQVSVLAPLGSALLGSCVNDLVTYKGRDDVLRTIVVKKLVTS